MECLRRKRCTVLCISVLALTFCGGEKDKEAKPSVTPEPATSPIEPPPRKVLDPSFLPSAALAELAQIPLDGAPPCSRTLDTLRTLFEGIDAFGKRLSAASDEASAVQILGELSADLNARIPAIEARTESDELRRISAELKASMSDLAESLQLAGDALTTHDKQAAAANRRRIKNGVANTRSSIEGLVKQCAP